MKITATDADDPKTENSQIAYTIIDHKPDDDMFYIGDDGTIFVKNLLDREVWTAATLCSNDTNRNKIKVAIQNTHQALVPSHCNAHFLSVIYGHCLLSESRPVHSEDRSA